MAGFVATLDDLTPREHVESDPLDLDPLTSLQEWRCIASSFAFWRHGSRCSGWALGTGSDAIMNASIRHGGMTHTEGSRIDRVVAG